MSTDPESLRDLTRALFGRPQPEDEAATPPQPEDDTEMREFTRALIARATSE